MRLIDPQGAIDPPAPGICQWFQAATRQGDCPETASVEVTVGCVHEHVGTAKACKDHATEFADRAQGADCKPCNTAGHSCPVMVTTTPRVPVVPA